MHDPWRVTAVTHSPSVLKPLLHLRAGEGLGECKRPGKTAFLAGSKEAQEAGAEDSTQSEV